MEEIIHVIVEWEAMLVAWEAAIMQARIVQAMIAAAK